MLLVKPIYCHKQVLTCRTVPDMKINNSFTSLISRVKITKSIFENNVILKPYLNFIIEIEDLVIESNNKIDMYEKKIEMYERKIEMCKRNKFLENRKIILDNIS